MKFAGLLATAPHLRQWAIYPPPTFYDAILTTTLIAYLPKMREQLFGDLPAALRRRRGRR